MQAAPGPGPLVAIGGAEDKKGAARILREFVQLAGGVRSRLIVMTVAIEDTVGVGQEYVEVFGRTLMLLVENGGRLTYQIAVERKETGGLHWHCTCADWVYRCKDFPDYQCKHIRALRVRRPKAEARSPAA